MTPQTPSTSATAPQRDRPPGLRDDVLALVHRATFGYTTEEHGRARSMGFEAWRDEQLDPASIDDSAMDAALAALPTLPMDAATLYATYPPHANGAEFVSRQLRSARILRARGSKRQLLERTVEFWTDHFNIYGNDGILRYLKTVDDREVTRAHAFGRFRDLLGASATSGAMLVYLDNFANRAGALNENYARELMELHSLGVDGGFTEDDVLEVARCFTGWTLEDIGSPSMGAFVFRPALHDDGPKTVLGRSIPAGGGQQDGETVLDILASHPSTASFVSGKLCRFFLAYDPALATLDRVALTFRATGGDLAAVMREILSRQSFAENAIWQQTKLRRPLHLAIGALRSTGGDLTTTQRFEWELQQMGHVPFLFPSPNGYTDALEAWGSNLLPRWAFASRLLDSRIQGARVTNSQIGVLLGGAPPAQAAAALNRSLTGGRMSAVDVAEVQGFIDAQPSWDLGVARQAIALALSLPGTQWI